jgi:hypothetical protein
MCDFNCSVCGKKIFEGLFWYSTLYYSKECQKKEYN